MARPTVSFATPPLIPLHSAAPIRAVGGLVPTTSNCWLSKVAWTDCIVSSCPPFREPATASTPATLPASANLPRRKTVPRSRNALHR